MWSGGDDINDKGESVRLYQPIQYGRKPDQGDPCATFVGGGGRLLDRPNCSVCQAGCYLLAQLHVPSIRGEDRHSRTYQVFACNRSACWASLFQAGPLCHGGGGVVFCRSADATTSKSSTSDNRGRQPEASTPFDATTTTPSSWADEEDTQRDDGGWGDADDCGLDALESKLNAMECKEDMPERPTNVPAAGKKEEKRKQSPPDHDAFPCFELHSLQEPHARRLEGTDDDDVGIGSGARDNDKIQQMLARYMAEEDDEGILAALRGATNDDFGAGGSGSGGKERDERLSAEDRTLLTYTDRLKRSPRQVIRYACDGVPLWSIPVSSISESKKPPSRGKSRSGTLHPIPPGPSGEQRVFLFQLLPSLLHVLQVDSTGSHGSLDVAFAQGGMNWGNIAVYTSSSPASERYTEDYVVVQESVDGTPTLNQPIGSTEPVVIADGTDFGADSDGDEAAEGEMEETWRDDED